jgi:hypothetical protein
VAEYDRGHSGHIGFLSIKEAAVQYSVSRAKVHRHIRAGQLRARKDPRDRRVTLLLQDELDRLFDIPEDTTRDNMNYETTKTAGRLTSEMRARVDALRGRMAARGTAGMVDSAAIIRAERERRTVELGDAVVGP